MHKRILDFKRLLPFVLLTTLLFPTIAKAAGPTGATGKEQPPAFDRLDNPQNSSETQGFGYLYTVVAGDDLWLIAKAHGLSMETLAQANDLEPPFWIYPDDRLWIPAAPAKVERPPTPTPTPAPTPTPVATPVPVAAAPPPAAPAAPITATQTAEVAAAPTEVAASPAEVVAAPAEALAAAAAPTVSGDARLIFDLMNQKRTANGLPALAWSDQLTVAAQAHADDCARRGWGSHVGSDGARLRTRLARAGYEPTWTSENWANAIGAESAFYMWYWEGPGGAHYDNIMSWNYTQAGVGVARSSWGYYYIVDFGQP